MSGLEWIHPGYNLYIEDQGRNVMRADVMVVALFLFCETACLSLYLHIVVVFVHVRSIFYICSSSLFSFHSGLDSL